MIVNTNYFINKYLRLKLNIHNIDFFIHLYEAEKILLIIKF